MFTLPDVGIEWYEADGQHYDKSQRVFPTVGGWADKAEAEWERSKYREEAAIVSRSASPVSS